ncbi:MAG: hypothetical protein PHW96_02385 [Candidatus Nanoarchaeia archaeon]|nr:hypothetical protein [Candidatus Nanoarchaeia archaeon]
MNSRWILTLILFIAIMPFVYASEGALQITAGFVEDEIIPGDEVLLHIIFANPNVPTATTRDTNMKVSNLFYQIELPRGVSFARTKDSGIISVGYVYPNSYTEHYIPLKISDNVSYGNHVIELVANYGVFNFPSNTTVHIPLIVRDSSMDFLLQIDSISPKVLTEGNAGVVSLIIANIGFFTAGGVNVEIMDNENIVLNARKSSYLGSLNSWDYTSASFDVIPLSEGEIDIDFKITYTDIYEQRVEKIKSAVLNVGDTRFSDISYSGLSIEPLVNIIGFLFIAFAGIFILYHFLKSRRKKK